MDLSKLNILGENTIMFIIRHTKTNYFENIEK